ncbi:DUF3014 domain-containing protein [Ferrimonas balearica]|uniref:DUF3014 domain-containing protein n=1 Tax=Ferrimonas balearica TaxID=44012 RepID=UPI001C997857|nr:DUF3014 domain-containing protein [Ferrimonas balearica]MBY5994108.1 DUF3014 domain-containing protein [Ferrimonas balearica]
MYQDDEAKRSSANQMAMVLVILVILACGGAWYFFLRDAQPPAPSEPIPSLPQEEPTLPAQPLPAEPVPEPVPEPELPPQPEPTPTPQPEVPEPDPLPNLNDSDEFAKEQLNAISDGMQFGQAVEDNNLIRRFVVFVDNLAGGEVMRQQGPFTPLSDDFKALELNGKLYLDPEGYRRFDQYAEFLYRLDETQLRDHFMLAEPLLEQAFQELGYGAGQFRGSIVDGIDELLAAPEYDAPLELVSHSVNYQFADPSIENLTDAQKLMIRMGPDNARKIKSLLRRFKAALNE